MSQEQYNMLLSNLLREKHALAKLRVELEGRKGKLYRYCKGFGHLARNCRKLKEETKRTVVSQNKFEVLRSRVMQCGVKERVVRSVRTGAVKCFKCGKEGHKCRECPLWVKRERKAARPEKEKAQQGERLVHPEKGKAQEKEKKLRRVEENGLG